MKESKRRSLATVLYGLGRVGLVVAMHKIELTENVRVVGRDARYLEYDDAELELCAEFEVFGQRGVLDAIQPLPDEVARQIGHRRGGRVGRAARGGHRGQPLR